MVEAGGQIGKPETISPKLAESAPKYHPWTSCISRISETASRFFKRVSPETLADIGIGFGLAGIIFYWRLEYAVSIGSVYFGFRMVQPSIERYIDRHPNSPLGNMFLFRKRNRRQ